jgi:hypothetical protein
MMRAYPFGLIFHDDIDKAEHWAVEHSKLTHRDPIALAACTAVGVGVAQVLRDEEVMTVTLAMVKAARRYCPKTANIIERAVDDAWSWPRRSVDLRSCVFPSDLAARSNRVPVHPRTRPFLFRGRPKTLNNAFAVIPANRTGPQSHNEA